MPVSLFARLNSKISATKIAKGIKLGMMVSVYHQLIKFILIWRCPAHLIFKSINAFFNFVCKLYLKDKTLWLKHSWLKYPLFLKISIRSDNKHWSYSSHLSSHCNLVLELFSLLLLSLPISILFAWFQYPLYYHSIVYKTKSEIVPPREAAYSLC